MQDAPRWGWWVVLDGEIGSTEAGRAWPFRGRTPVLVRLLLLNGCTPVRPSVPAPLGFLLGASPGFKERCLS